MVRLSAFVAVAVMLAACGCQRGPVSQGGGEGMSATPAAAPAVKPQIDAGGYGTSEAMKRGDPDAPKGPTLTVAPAQDGSQGGVPMAAASKAAAPEPAAVNPKAVVSTR